MAGTLQVDTIINSSGTGSPTFPNGLSYNGYTGGAAFGAGIVGQILKSIVSGINAGSSTVTSNVTSLILSAGFWLVSAGASVNNGSSTLLSNNNVELSLSLSNNSLTGIIGTGYDQLSLILTANASAGGSVVSLTIPPQIVNISTNTTIYLNANVAYSTATPSWSGGIYAVRIA